MAMLSRVVVPSSSSDSSSACVPSLALSSAAWPASNDTATCTTGRTARRANTTLMPLESVVRSIAGKLRSATGCTGGGAIAGFAAGVAGAGAPPWEGSMK